MNELIQQVGAVARGMWKYRWPGVIVAWVVAAVATVGVFRIPDKFEASARVYVDTQSILKPLMAGLAVQPNVDQQVGMLGRTLISRPNVEKLVRMADLDLGASTKEQQEELVDKMTTALRISSTGRDNLYTLSFEHEDQDKAKRVVQALLSIFIESGLGANRRDNITAKQFLDEQIASYERQLDEAEAKMLAFRLRNLDLKGVDGRDSAARLSEISEQLSRARLELREVENARAAARAQLEAERQQQSNLATASLLQESSISVATPEIDARIDAQKRNLDTLLTRFTDQHPDVVMTRRLLKDLEAQKAKEVQALRQAAMAAPPPAVGSGAQNIALQELSRVVAATEVQAASLRARVGEYESRMAKAREDMKLAPQLETESAQLSRDHALLKKNYEALIASRQSAEMSGQLESASGLADFRVIEPPRVSPKPVSPNRLLLVPLALVAALGAGLFVAFAISQMRPAVFSASDLRQKTGLPVLGVVSMVMDAAESRRVRMDLLRFTLASGGLVGLFIAGMAAMAVMAR
jgi:polysaccharide chain length determinant protein (PEP-CTERM system associated)